MNSNKKEMNPQLPSFFRDFDEENTKVDSGYETLMDFFLGWTIRCAEKKYQAANPTVNFFARKLVHALI